MILQEYRISEINDTNIDFKQFMIDHGAIDVERDDNIYTINYKGLTFSEIIGSPQLLRGIKNVELSFDDLISDTDLGISVNVIFEEGFENTISKYKYFVYKGEELFKQTTTSESSWIVDGLKSGETYKIWVSAYDDIGLKEDSEVRDYQKLSVYSWNKYSVGEGTLSEYKYNASGWTWYYFSAPKEFSRITDLDTCFNKSTGVWTANTSSLTINRNASLPRNNGILLDDGKAIDARNLDNTGWSSSKMILMHVVVYSVVPVYTYTKNSNIPIDSPVRSNNENAFPTEDGGGYQDGYWYEKINN